MQLKYHKPAANKATNYLYQINLIRIVFPFCKSTENRHVPAPSFCFRRTIDTFSQPLLQVLRGVGKVFVQILMQLLCLDTNICPNPDSSINIAKKARP